ncbi:pyridoxamine 5'-phosphate oxidase family protein [Kitasatospora sp. NPDC047058]|uniref:pyridoxamine 5'-phosphate oxidase family protein n=1 Tax=Kitasatospora sp. NPDC047058 TaxID=3155620 RepID=UPI0033FBEFA3
MLGTAVTRMPGDVADLPPGPEAAPARRVLVELTVPECWRRLEPGGLGRVALTTAQGPLVLPVDFRVSGGGVLLRTAAHGTLALTPGAPIAFEAGRTDEAFRTGWSVLVTGRAAAFDEPDATGRPIRHGGPDPWAGGRRDAWIRLRPTAVTGRVIRPVDRQEDVPPTGG